MTEEIRRAVIQAIAARFQLPVYGQRVPQGAKKPCFTVELKETEQKRLLGRRAARKAGCGVRYGGEEGRAAASECAEALDGLYEVLCIIGREERFAASRMQEKRTETGIRFMAEYEYHVMLKEETTERMGRLKYNGKEAVGYEEKGDIQQRAAE